MVAISAGEYHNLALKSDGTVVAWGDNADGETTVPAGLTNVIAISGGGFHSLALTSDGIVHAWGDNSANQTTVPLSLSNVVAIAGGGLHSLALSSIYGLNQTNNAPFWTNGLAGSTRTMNELTTLLVTNTATDTNFPPQTLSYALTNLLAWVSINSQGVITLLPQEADGPSTNIISTVVTDNGHPALSATNSFTLIVNEVNLAPYWPTNVPSQTNYVIGVSNLLTVTNTASDSDLPTNSLTYTNWVSPAANPPAISTNGIITWTPQSVGTFVITNVVTDYNPWALTNQNLSATNYFTVTVTNAPTPPPNAISIASIIYTNITGTNGFLLTWFAPSNDLFKVQWTASLAPTSWNTFTNIISYNPNITPVNPTNAQFNFFDDGSQFPFGTTRFYRLLLLNSLSNTPPVLPLQTNQTIFALTTLVVTNTAMDSDLPAQTLTYVLVNPSSGAAIDANGVITWTPTVNQALTNYTFTTVVTDSGTPPLSATNSFVVTVKPAVLGLTNATFFYLGAITTDGTNLYAVNAGGNPQTNYVISISLPFNTNSLVAPTYANVDISSSLNGLATHGTNLFWIDPNANPPPSGGTTTFRGDKNGGPIIVYNDPGTIFDGSDLTADSSQLFAVDYQGGKVTRLAFDFSSEISIGAARYFGPERLNTLTVANGTVYVADSAGSVVSLSTNGGSYTSVYVGAPLIYPDGIAANAGALFVVDSGATNTIWMLPISGGTPVPLLSGLPFRAANRITYWNHALYVTDNNAHGTNGIIWQVSLPNPSPVVSGVSVATNGMNLSWTAPIYDQFQVEWTTNLTPVVSWNVLPNIITSTNGAFSFTDTNVVSGMKFYRLLLLP